MQLTLRPLLLTLERGDDAGKLLRSPLGLLQVFADRRRPRLLRIERSTRGGVLRLQIGAHAVQAGHFGGQLAQLALAGEDTGIATGVGSI